MRQSGRTTRVLQEANEAKKRGERVLIVCSNSRIQDNTIMLARKLGFLANAPNGGLTGNLERKKDFAVARQVIGGQYRGFRGAVFEDHTVSEMLSTSLTASYSREIDMMQLMQQHDLPDLPRWKFQPF